MKKILTLCLALIAGIVATSCTKDVTEGLRTSIDGFRDGYVDRNYEGQSRLHAQTQDNIYELDIYFDNITDMKVGETLNPSRCLFGSFFTTSSGGRTNTYNGKITLEYNNNQYVVFRFHKVTFDLEPDAYVMDGYLRCILF